MKKYRAYTAKKFRLPRRIIFFCVVALIIVVLAIVLGNFLKGKLDSTPRDTSDITTTPKNNEDAPSGDKNEEESAEHDPALSGVVSGYLDLSDVVDDAGITSVLDEMKTKGFNSLSFCVTDKEGKLTYASPAVEEASRLPASVEIVSYDILVRTVAMAKASGLRASAVMTVSDSLSDRLVVKELSEAGFDELILRGFEKYLSLDNDTVLEIGSFIDGVREISGNMALSLCFDTEFFMAPSNAPYIEKIYQNVEFLSVDLTAVTAEEIPELTDKIAGSISAYLLRPILNGEDGESAALIDTALSDAFFVARQYISAPEKADPPEDGSAGNGSTPDGSGTADTGAV